MKEMFTFPCGCSFPIIKQSNGTIPFLEMDEDNLPECKAVFDLISTGKTKGIFQLESNLGKYWAKKVKPENDEHMAALGSILRPGVLQSKSEIDGKSMTEHYAMRKNGEEECVVIHESLKDILGPTYDIVAFQEQIMAIAAKIAGFNMAQVGKLRKSVGKKDQQLLAKVGIEFIEGCKKTGIVSEEIAKQVWEQIKKSGRYAFNKSHAMSYGLNGYDSAYMKSHIPVAFFANWLYYAKEKMEPQEETRELVEDAKYFDIDIETPDIVDKKKRVYTDMVKVKFGICDVKGVGESQYNKFREANAKSENLLKKSLSKFTWEEFLFYVSDHVSSTFMTNLIYVGAFRSLAGKKSRGQLKLEYDVWCELTVKEKEKLIEIFPCPTNLLDMLKKCCKIKKEGGICFNVKRVESIKSQISMLENPPVLTDDLPNIIANLEEEYLGVPITYAKVDGCDLSSVNITCKDFNKGEYFKTMYFGVNLQSVRKFTTKTGKNAGQEIAFLSIQDATGSVSDVCVWSEAVKKFNHLLVEKNNVLIKAYKDKKRGNLNVEEIYQL